MCTRSHQQLVQRVRHGVHIRTPVHRGGELLPQHLELCLGDVVDAVARALRDRLVQRVVPLGPGCGLCTATACGVGFWIEVEEPRELFNAARETTGPRTPEKKRIVT